MAESDNSLIATQDDQAQSTGKCPVDHQNGVPTSLWKLFGNKNGDALSVVSGNDSADARPQQQQQQSQQQQQQRGQTVASLEEAAKHAQSPHPTQRLPLSTYRMFSSIPRGNIQADNDTGTGSSNNNLNSNIPHHQIIVDSPTQSVVNGSVSSNNNVDATKAKSTWVYPSEQQVFNAMKRKGWDGIEEESIPSFLQIHNFVNERSWRLLCEWENEYKGNGNGGRGSDVNADNEIKLVRFEGRPTDMTPKAFFLSTFGLQPKPFDRHDWYIDNGTDHSKRYVLDFYMRGDENDGKDGRSGGMLPRVDIDVRPALDTPQAFIQRGRRFFKDLFPGISKELESLRSSADK